MILAHSHQKKFEYSTVLLLENVFFSSKQKGLHLEIPKRSQINYNCRAFVVRKFQESIKTKCYSFNKQHIMERASKSFQLMENCLKSQIKRFDLLVEPNL